MVGILPRCAGPEDAAGHAPAGTGGPSGPAARKATSVRLALLGARRRGGGDSPGVPPRHPEHRRALRVAAGSHAGPHCRDGRRVPVPASAARWLWSGMAGALLLWTAVSSWAAHPDTIAYFNELAGNRPERFLVDSDLDWGQDMGRLVATLRERHVPYLHMNCQYTGDDARLALPAWDTLEPYQPVTGWVAVSFTRLKTYAWLVARQQGRTELAFAWLGRYQPVARVGKSILLYYIPEKPTP